MQYWTSKDGHLAGLSVELYVGVLLHGLARLVGYQHVVRSKVEGMEDCLQCQRITHMCVRQCQHTT